MSEFDKTLPIPIITAEYDKLFDPETIIHELNNKELDQLTGEAYSRAVDLLDDNSDALHDCLHIWRICMQEHEHRIKPWNASND